MKMKRRHLILMSLYLKKNSGYIRLSAIFSMRILYFWSFPEVNLGRYCHYWYKLGWGIDLHCSFIRFSVSGSRSCLRLWVSF